MKAILQIFRNFLDKPDFLPNLSQLEEKRKPLKPAYYLGFKGF